MGLGLFCFTPTAAVTAGGDTMSDPQPGRVAPPTAQAGDKNDIEPIDEKRFTQADLDTLIRDRLERQRRALEAQRREEQQAAEAQKLEDTQEFEKLAKQRAKEIESLKPRAGLAESYEKGVSRLIGEATKALPSNIQMILNKLSLPDQLDWLTDNLESMKPPMVANGSADINAWSRGASGAPQPITDEEYRAKKRREMNW